MSHSWPRWGVATLLAWMAAMLPCQVPGENWPGWRGPRGDGTSLEKGVPVRWDGISGQGVVWKAIIEGTGHSSPIVWEDRIFLTTCSEETLERVLLCLDGSSGQVMWRQTVLRSPLEPKHKLNSFASGTPATDGHQVYVTFLDRKEMVVAAYDAEGRQQWLVRPGEFASIHGYCSSPVLFEDLVIVNGDHDGDSYIVALDRASGRTVWKVPREHKTRSYSTPLVRTIDGRVQMILAGSKQVASFDPRTGRRHWVIEGPTDQFVASVVYNGELVFMTCGYPERHILAIRPDGSGDVTETHIAWRTTENCAYVPSPIVVGEYFLVVSDDGIASCYQATSRRRLWRQRLEGSYSASLVAAEGLVYFLSDRGETTVVRPGLRFDHVAANPLGEACSASPAISRSRIYLRGDRHLFCVGN